MLSENGNLKATPYLRRIGRPWNSYIQIAICLQPANVAGFLYELILSHWMPPVMGPLCAHLLQAGGHTSDRIPDDKVRPLFKDTQPGRYVRALKAQRGGATRVLSARF